MYQQLLYQLKMTTNIQSNYLIDPTLNKVNRLFVLPFENEKDRTSFSSKYYTGKVEIKDFNVLIDGKSFFDVAITYNEEAYEQIIKFSKNNDYTTGNSLDHEYFSNHYKSIAVESTKQIEIENFDLKL